MMIKNVLLVTVALVVSGCSSKYETEMSKAFDKNIVKNKKLLKSEKLTFSQDGETKLALTATYLNGTQSLADDEEEVKETFIIGIYQSADVNVTGLHSRDQNLTLNIKYPETEEVLTKAEIRKRRKGIDALATTSRELSHSDPLLANIPLVNSWTKYYYVEFPHTTRKKFSLVFQNKQFGEIKSKKRAKSLKKQNDTKKKRKPRYKKYKFTFAKDAKYLHLRGKQKKVYEVLR
jgi:hypothetical protein